MCWHLYPSQVNGYLTLSENLADSGAVRTAYRAYDQWLAGQGDQETEARLPGANTTEKQTFFLAFAQVNGTSCLKVSRNVKQNRWFKECLLFSGADLGGGRAGSPQVILH